MWKPYIYLSELKNWIWAQAKALAIRLSKPAQYYNIGPVWKDRIPRLWLTPNSNSSTHLGVFLLIALFCLSATPLKRQTLLNSLDPFSLSQHLAYYRLYSDSDEGVAARKKILKLLQGNASSTLNPLNIPLNSLLNMISYQNIEQNPLNPLDNQTLEAIQQLSKKFSHHALKGHFISSEEDLASLADEEIDIARALLISQGNLNLAQIESYEALIDLMALQIGARLPALASSPQIIETINRFLFEEMAFKFPPLAQFENAIDRFTFLGSVIDSRKGVCLGMSILYLALAQRLDLRLEIITPPGHIYLRFKAPSVQMNIETTAGGIHVEDHFYLDINTRALPIRTLKEVIGLAHFNRASIYWDKKEFQNCLNGYLKAKQYLPNDHQLKELIAFSLILTEKEEEGKQILQQIKADTPAHLVVKECLADEYLSGIIDKTILEFILSSCEDKRSALVERKKTIETFQKSHPNSKSLYLQQGMISIQLHCPREALQALGHFHSLDSNHPNVEYLLTQLNMDRLDFIRAWEHLNKCKMLTGIKGHYPKSLKHLERSLTLLCPPSTRTGNH